MQNLMPPVDTPDNLFHDGNPTTGVEGTIVTAQHLNNEQGATRDIQAELINVLAAAAMQPDPEKQDQLVQAIQLIISGAMPTIPVTSVNAKTGAVVLGAGDVGALPKGGTAVAATKLAISRKIAGVAFDGTADITLTSSDVSAISDGDSGSSTTGPEWSARSGIYTFIANNSSMILFHLNKAGGSSPAMQIRADYANRGIWYRSARDANGFEVPWSEFYTSSRPPRPSELGMYTNTEINNLVNSRSIKNTGDVSKNGWHRCGDTGLITQWGEVGAGVGNVNITFPVPFPNVCLNMLNTVIGGGGEKNLSSVANYSRVGATIGRDQNGANWIATGY